MTDKKSISKYLKILINGILMGTANKIPGVSGGLVAIAIGFYEELIFSLKRFDKTALKHLLKAEFKCFFKHVNGKFLFLILLGIVISYFSTSKLLEILLNNFEIYVWSLFFGLVIGTIFHLRSIIEINNFKNICFIILGASIGIFLSFANPAQENDNLYFVFVCGIISVSGMILPGLSGSFLLMLLGNYVLLLVDSVNALYDTLFEIIQGDFGFIDHVERMRMLKVLAVFTLGSVAGLVTFSHFLNFVLSRFKDITLAVLNGFIIGSLGVVWPWKETIYKLNEQNQVMLDSTGNMIIENYLRFIPEWSNETLVAVLFILSGIMVVLGLEWYGKKTSKDVS